MTDSFGRYRLLGEIARGGMGVVYKAFDPVMDREVALKVMLGEDPEEAGRFEREVRTAAQLRHPNIVAAHDVGVEQGRPYYTMDLLTDPSGGASRRTISARGALGAPSGAAGGPGPPFRHRPAGPMR